MNGRSAMAVQVFFQIKSLPRAESAFRWNSNAQVNATRMQTEAVYPAALRGVCLAQSLNIAHQPLCMLNTHNRLTTIASHAERLMAAGIMQSIRANAPHQQ